MTMAIPVLPETAPFTPAQRAWLNGFFAGLVNLHGGGGNGAAISAVTAVAPAAGAQEVDDDAPWHDPALSMEERLKLAEDRPYPRRLMAAMAQLDCGACGYLCKTYAQAISTGAEKDLTRCAPGGKETSRKLKELVAANGTSAKFNGAVAGITAKASPIARAPAPTPPTFGRHNPFPAPLLECAPLNKPGSMKDTRFVAFDLKGSDLSYKAGDALGVFPENDPDLVTWVVDALDATGTEDVLSPDGPKVTLHEALLKHYSLGRPTDLLLELLINSAADPDEAEALKEILVHDNCPEGDEVLDLLKQFPSARPVPEEFVAALNPLQPRLYSISSSLKAHPGQVHLTVGVVRYVNTRGRQCKGVCSTFFADRVKPGSQVRVFVHPSHAFGVPHAGDTPMIMVGPGTGVAPFRAFLQERGATGATGRNWLFFGDQQRELDFLYAEELEGYRRDGLLTRLDTAFSRDQKEKVYVQHRMLENGAELWRWLQDGAHFYVCGDAKRMATDVDNTLRQIAGEHGGMSPDRAKAYVADLAKAGRYQRDVY
jgi:sulfite reductase (NADPH) flavoprotein alpha-component